MLLSLDDLDLKKMKPTGQGWQGSQFFEIRICKKRTHWVFESFMTNSSLHAQDESKVCSTEPDVIQTHKSTVRPHGFTVYWAMRNIFSLKWCCLSWCYFTKLTTVSEIYLATTFDLITIPNIAAIIHFLLITATCRISDSPEASQLRLYVDY